MSKIFITATATATATAMDTLERPWAYRNFFRTMKAAERSNDRRFQLADDPGSADINLFVEPRFAFQSDVLSSPLYRAFPEKSVVLDFLDNPRPVVPGLYVGMTPAQASFGVFEGGAYIRVADNRLLEQESLVSRAPDLLFSFVGKAANANRLRSAVLALKHPRALVMDRSSGQSESDSEYVQTLARSMFVLCPRGKGPSSWRLFETMRMGRVPVVISDDWVAPLGIDWDSFVVRVAEADVHEIPSLLTGLEAQWAARGQRAHQEWEGRLSYERMFGWIGERCMAILEKSRSEGYSASLPMQLARVDSIRSAARLMRERFNNHSS